MKIDLIELVQGLRKQALEYKSLSPMVKIENMFYLCQWYSNYYQIYDAKNPSMSLVKFGYNRNNQLAFSIRPNDNSKHIGYKFSDIESEEYRFQLSTVDPVFPDLTDDEVQTLKEEIIQLFEYDIPYILRYHNNDNRN